MGIDLAAPGAGTARRSDERGRECEQTDREHDERAVHADDLAHRSLLSGFVVTPVTLDPTPNRPTTGG
jgi:hypothetical protein